MEEPKARTEAVLEPRNQRTGSSSETKRRFSPGEDGIRYSVIKKFPLRGKEKFLQLVNDMSMQQNVPDVLKRVLMVLIPKPNRDLQKLNSHRPIALLSVYLKIINSMIKTRLENMIRNKKILDEKSYGFVKGRSCCL